MSLRESLHSQPSNYRLRRKHLRILVTSSWGRLTPYTDLRVRLSFTPKKSYIPRTAEWRTPGRSRAPPPRTKILEWRRRLWPIPGIWATTCLPLFKKTLTAGRLAELGFLGVTIRGRKTLPAACGWPKRAAALGLRCLLMSLWYRAFFVDKIKQGAKPQYCTIWSLCPQEVQTQNKERQLGSPKGPLSCHLVVCAPKTPCILYGLCCG